MTVMSFVPQRKRNVIFENENSKMYTISASCNREVRDTRAKPLMQWLWKLTQQIEVTTAVLRLWT